MITYASLTDDTLAQRLLRAIATAHGANLSYAQRLEQARMSDTLFEPLQSLEIQSWYEQVRDWLSESNNHFVTFPNDDTYPEHLYALKTPPVILYGHGNPKLLKARSLAMVGSRHASAMGAKLAHHFAMDMAGKGWVIVSGLAEGIDGASHEGALAANGATVAVLGSGLSNIYPGIHLGLAKRIVDNGGCLISEYPPTAGPRRGFFPQRNRIIAALADGTLVVEAAPRSGSLITARVSSEIGRACMALPGSIHSPHSKGCHTMIRQGAALVETTGDIEEELLANLPPNRLAPYIEKNRNSEIHKPTKNAAVQHGSLEQAILNAMGHEPCHVDDIAHRTGHKADDVLGLLTEMELEGLVINEAGARWQQVILPS